MHKQLCSFPKKHKQHHGEHVLSCERPDDYQELLRSLTDHYQPADNAEEWLVQQLAHTQWRIGRAQACESATYALLLDRMRPHFEAENIPHEHRLIKIWNPAQVRTQATSAYEARLWRIANQIRTDLERLASSRHQSDPPRRPALAKRRRPAA
jgi:hypothetical protein